MSGVAKALKTVGLVVGAVALVATGVGIALGGLAAGAATAAAGTAMAVGHTLITVGTIASVAAGALTLAGTLLTPKPSFSSSGNPQQFSTNSQSGLPIGIGRSATSGLKIHGRTSRSYTTSAFDDILHFVILLSCAGQQQAIEQFTADTEVVSFDADGQAIGGFYLWMSQRVSLGQPGAGNQDVGLHYQTIPGWTADHKLSGMSFATWQLKFDPDGGYYSGGVPNPRWVGKWSRVYDPRLDSTYPGGSGPCRALDESTYVWSRNGPLNALTWAMGRHQNGKLTVGIGAPLSMIRVADFVEAANVADANGWGCGGFVYSTDSKWDVLKSMLQAGGAVPTMTAAMIGCRVNAPRVSIATITSADILDSLSIATTKPRRERINTVRPRFRSEAHNWEIITGSAVTAAEFVAADGGVRSRELDMPLVQAEVDQEGYDGERQVGQLAAYDLVNAREAGPITFSTGPKYIGLRNGDCVTLDVPEEGLANTKVLLTSDPVFDPATGKFRFSCETETDSKHDFALGKTTTPPPPFAPTPPDVVPPQPLAADWTLSADISADGLPELVIAGSQADPLWAAVLVSYRKVGAPSWTFWGEITSRDAQRAAIPGVDGAASYEAQIAYRGASGAVGEWLALAAVGTPANSLTANVPLGMNLVINSDYVAGLRGHVADDFNQTGLPLTKGLNLPGWSGQTNVAWFTVTGTPVLGLAFDGFSSLPAFDLAGIKRGAIPVKLGERLYYSQLMATHRCAAQPVLFYLKGDGSYLTEVGPGTLNGSQGSGFDFANGDPAKAVRVGAFHDVPADARYAFLGMRGYGAGQADPYVFVGAPFIAKVAPGQMAVPPYTSGPTDRAADVTGENTAANTAAVGAKTAAQLLADLTQAQSDATAGKTDATSALGQIGIIVSDGYLDRSEKPALSAEWDAIYNERSLLDARADAMGITSEKASYDGAWQALGDYLAGLTPGWNDYAHDTAIVRTTFNGKFTDLYYARQLLLDKIAAVAKARADQGVSDAGAAQSSANSALGQIGVIVADDVLDRSEKPAVAAQWQAIYDERATIDARADAFGITTEKATYDGAWDALGGYLAGLTPGWNDYGSDTPIFRATFNGKFTDLYYARQALLDKVAAVAKARADQGVSDAGAAQSSANSALGQIGVIASDSYLDRSEKPSIVAKWQDIANEQSILDARAAAFGVTTERTTYNAAVSALSSYLSSLTPAWYDYSQDTGIVRATFNGKFGDVYYARQALLDAIAAVAATRSSWSGVSGAGKPQDGATVGAPSGTNVGGTDAGTVEAGANAANEGVNSDGTIKTDKVVRSSLTGDAIATSSRTTSGYIEFQDGTIIQYGTVTADLTYDEFGNPTWDTWYPEGNYSISFPITFPNACLVVVPQVVGDGSIGSTGDYWGQVKAGWTASGFEAVMQTGWAGKYAMGFSWIAIGY